MENNSERNVETKTETKTVTAHNSNQNEKNNETALVAGKPPLKPRSATVRQPNQHQSLLEQIDSAPPPKQSSHLPEVEITAKKSSKSSSSKNSSLDRDSVTKKSDKSSADSSKSGNKKNQEWAKFFAFINDKEREKLWQVPELPKTRRVSSTKSKKFKSATAKLSSSESKNTEKKQTAANNSTSSDSNKKVKPKEDEISSTSSSENDEAKKRIGKQVDSDSDAEGKPSRTEASSSKSADATTKSAKSKNGKGSFLSQSVWGKKTLSFEKENDVEVKPSLVLSLKSKSRSKPDFFYTDEFDDLENQNFGPYNSAYKSLIRSLRYNL
jgi:hypothetical protein